MPPVFVDSYTLTAATGTGLAAIRESVANGRTGLTDRAWPDCDIDTWYGRVTDLDAAPPLDDAWNSRNNRLARLGLEQDGFAARARDVIDRCGADRCAVVLGTSTSSIGRTERAYRALNDARRFTPDYLQAHIHNPHSTGAYVAHYLGVTGPALSISTACSSSAKAFASAARLLEREIVDAVIVGGVDSLCLSVLYGFYSLQLIAANPCRPFDRDREGINLGEAAGFALLVRERDGNARVSLLGYGESLDAYHMSSAHPDGLGARLAMRSAIDRSNLSFDDIDYLNLHGTATRANDDIEGMVCADLFGERTVASATKGWTGHTLGAAGATEALICVDSLVTGLIPGTANTRTPDRDIGAHLLLTSRELSIDTAMSNSFGFGGNNCSLVFART